MKQFGWLFAGLAMIASIASAQGTWTFDKVHSSVQFSIKHMVISTVTGSFKDFSVDLKSDKADFSDATVSAVIKVASINTDNTMRDGHLKSDDFFNAEKFPEIKFVSTKFEKVGENKYKITGNLTIRDITKEAVFDATLGGTLKTDRGTLVAWSASTTVNRFDYNLKWNKALESGGLIVGQDVMVTLNLELNKQ